MVSFTVYFAEERHKKVPMTGKRFLTHEGFLRPGWGLLDYLKHAVEGERFECVLIWGQPGTGKSNLARQILYGIYGDWSKVLKYTVTSIDEMLEVVKEWQESENKPYAIVLDDISRVLPRQLWQENKQLYIAFSKALQVIRSLFRVIIVTVPDIRFVPEPVINMQTFDVHVTPSHNFYANKLVKTADVYSRRAAYVRKILVEVGHFELSDEPYEVYVQYAMRRRQMAFDAMEAVKEAMVRKKPVKEVLAKFDGKQAEEKGLRMTCIKCGKSWRYVPKGYTPKTVTCLECGTKQPFFLACENVVYG